MNFNLGFIMARISGVDIPGEKTIVFALTAVYGVGPIIAKKIVGASKIPAEKRAKELSDEEVSKLQKEVGKFPVEGELRRLVSTNIKRLEELGSYRGIRHKKGLPARGQRTRSNARTKRGKRRTVGAMKKAIRAKMGQSS